MFSFKEKNLVLDHTNNPHPSHRHSEGFSSWPNT